MTLPAFRFATLRRAAACLLLLSLAAAPAAGQSLTVERVDPPHWWTGMTWDRVQLMLYGDDLHGLEAATADSAVSVQAVHTVPNPSYAFVDLAIADDAPAGTYAIQLRRGSAETTVAYELRERADSTGRYQGFRPEDVVYLITPDRFANGDTTNDRVAGLRDEYAPSDPRMRHGGDLDGIIERLDYLKDLGVTTLWLNPVLENRGINSYHGYKTTDFYRIDPRFGTNDDYRRLVAEAHARGLKVIFDHVSNHIGLQHPWVGNLPRASWLNGSVADHRSNRHYKMSISDPYADPRSEKLLRTFWFVDRMPDLNQRDPLVANYLIQNTLWWIETTGLDGIREDTYPYANQAFLARWASAIQAEYPHFNIVGEIWDTNPAYVALFQEESRLPRDFETNLPAVMDFPLSEAFRAYLRGDGALRDVYQVLAQDFVYSDPQNLMTLMDNHDMPRGIYVADGQTQRVKQVLKMLLTTRGIPQLLYGTELNMKGGASHVELREDMPGGFPGDTRSAFTETGRTAEENDMFDFVQTLLQLRQEHPALTRGTLTHYPPTYGNDVYRYKRQHAGETILVIVNGHDEQRAVDLAEVLDRPLGDRPLVNLMTGEAVPVSAEEQVDIGRRGALVLRLAE